MAINIRIRDGMCPDPSTGDGGATEGDIRGAVSDIINIVGVKDLAGGHCLVTENSPASMSVLVAPGVVYIPNVDYDELDSNTVRFWEAIITVSTAVTIAENVSGSTRIDLICVKMDTTVTPDEHASNIATLVIIQGTPGAGAPALPDNHAKLAEVEVADDAVTIIAADITDSRTQSKINSDYLDKATGATVNTGTDDTTIVTPKALADSTIGKAPASALENVTGTDNAKFLTALANVPAFYKSLSANCIINGGFTVNQRVYVSNATLAAGVYGHDRWKAGAGGGDYTFIQLAQATTITIKTGKTLIQVIEDKNVIGGTYTLSWTGTAQARFGINSNTPSGAYAANPITITTQTAGTVMSIEFNEGTLGQINLANSSVALPFMPKSFEDELRACQRYYEKSYRYSVAVPTNTSPGYVQQYALATTANGARFNSVHYKVNKRTSANPVIYPYTTATNTMRVSDNGGTDLAANSGAIQEVSEIAFSIKNNSGGNITTGNAIVFHWSVDAEL